MTFRPSIDAGAWLEISRQGRANNGAVRSRALAGFYAKAVMPDGQPENE